MDRNTVTISTVQSKIIEMECNAIQLCKYILSLNFCAAYPVISRVHNVEYTLGNMYISLVCLIVNYTKILISQSRERQ